MVVNDWKESQERNYRLTNDTAFARQEKNKNESSIRERNEKIKMEFSITNSFQQLDIFSPNCTVRYWYRAGSGKKYVILLHGASCDHVTFEKQIDIFDDSYHVIVWDARCHGLSKLEASQKFDFKDMLDDCLRLFEIHQIEKAILIGQSMGGNLAQEIAYYHPEKVEKLVIIESTQNTQKFTWFERLTLKYARKILSIYPWSWYLSSGIKLSGTTEYTCQYVKKCLSRMGKNRHIEIMLSLINVLHEDKNYRFGMPVLLLCGEESTAGNIKKIVKKWAAADENITLRMIPNARHCANMDNPEDVNKKILEFIAIRNGENGETQNVSR